MNFEIKHIMISMNLRDYLEDCIGDFPEHIETAGKTPSTKALMKLSHHSPLLDYLPMAYLFILRSQGYKRDCTMLL